MVDLMETSYEVRPVTSAEIRRWLGSLLVTRRTDGVRIRVLRRHVFGELFDEGLVVAEWPKVEAVVNCGLGWVAGELYSRGTTGALRLMSPDDSQREVAFAMAQAWEDGDWEQAVEHARRTAAVLVESEEGDE